MSDIALGTILFLLACYVIKRMWIADEAHMKTKACPKVEHQDGTTSVMDGPRWDVYQARAEELNHARKATPAAVLRAKQAEHVQGDRAHRDTQRLNQLRADGVDFYNWINDRNSDGSPVAYQVKVNGKWIDVEKVEK